MGRSIFDFNKYNRFITDPILFGWSLVHGYHPNPATPKLQHTSKQEHTTNVVMQYKSRRLLMMDVLMSETYWA